MLSQQQFQIIFRLMAAGLEYVESREFIVRLNNCPLDAVVDELDCSGCHLSRKVLSDEIAQLPRRFSSFRRHQSTPWQACDIFTGETLEFFGGTDLVVELTKADCGGRFWVGSGSRQLTSMCGQFIELNPHSTIACGMTLNIGGIHFNVAEVNILIPTLPMWRISKFLSPQTYRHAVTADLERDIIYPLFDRFHTIVGRSNWIGMGECQKMAGRAACCGIDAPTLWLLMNKVARNLNNMYL